MNNLYLDILHMRRPTLNYVSPAICDAIFSSTSFPTLVLDPLPSKPAVTGLRITFIGFNGDFLLTWDNYPGALCYSVYKVNDATDPFGAYTLIAECISDEEYDPHDWEIPFLPEEPGCYLVTAITKEGEVAVSDPICTDADGDGDPDIPSAGGCLTNPNQLPNGVDGEEYSVTFTPDGPADDPQFTLVGGSFPDGLVLGLNTGVLTGTPTEAGDFEFTIRLTKDGGGFCEKTFQLTIEEGFPDPLAWWTMDAGTPTNLVDSVSGLVMTSIAGGGFMSFQPGKVANGYQHVSSVGQSVVSVCTSANLALTGLQGQVSIVFWCNVISVNNPFLTNNTGMSFTFDQNGASFIVNSQRLNNGFWIARLDGLGTLQIADPGGWVMVVVTFDCATSTIGLSVNNSAIITQIMGASPTPGAHTQGTMVLGTDANDPWTARFDEVTLFPVILDADQIAYLWNEGNGRTFGDL